MSLLRWPTLLGVVASADIALLAYIDSGWTGLVQVFMACFFIGIGLLLSMRLSK